MCNDKYLSQAPLLRLVAANPVLGLKKVFFRPRNEIYYSPIPNIKGVVDPSYKMAISKNGEKIGEIRKFSLKFGKIPTKFSKLGTFRDFRYLVPSLVLALVKETNY